jgi:predicted transposase/invertase (TIGR01784 family)
MSKNINYDVSKLLPTNDYIFKRMFGTKGSEKITESFIQNFVGFKDIKIQEVIEDKILEKDLLTDKVGILDVLAKSKNDENINLEMQCGNYQFIKDRLIFYICKCFSSDSIYSGEKYGEIRKTIAVLISKDKLDFLQEIPKYRTSWHFREDEFSTKILTDKLQVVIIELEKIIDAVNKSQLEPNNKTALWANFLLDPKTLGGTDMKENEDIKKANDKYEEILSDEQERRRALSRQMYFMDISSAKAEGKVEGKIEGSKEEKIKIAKKMLTKNKDIEEIMEYIDLTKEEILKIKNENN